MAGLEQLKLENQLCFPLYAASRMITKMYLPLLKKLNLTYPQYLIMLVLWEQGESSVTDIGEKLLLETNTLTPLLKRMETKGLLRRQRAREDERKVMIKLTRRGKAMEEQAGQIPFDLIQSVGDDFSQEQALRLREDLKALLNVLC